MEETKTPGHNDGGHEHRDVNVVAVTRFGLGLAAGVVVAGFLMWFLFDRFAARETRSSPLPAPMSMSDPEKEPPEPRLQPAPIVDLKEVRAAEEAILSHYAWVDPDKGIVRIPIDRAMDLIAKEGLPVRPQ